MVSPPSYVPAQGDRTHGPTTAPTVHRDKWFYPSHSLLPGPRLTGPPNSTGHGSSVLLMPVEFFLRSDVQVGALVVCVSGAPTPSPNPLLAEVPSLSVSSP